MIRLLPALFLLPGLLRAAEPPLPEVERAKMREGFHAQLVALNESIKESPGVVQLYSQRGDRHLFLGHFAAAVTDYEKMVALDPALDAPHWRLGIAYYFNHQFAQCARQFEKYHAYDGGDRENGIWKFLGDVKTLGLPTARKTMLAYTRFDREPFPDLYELLAGKMTREAFFAGLKARDLSTNSQVMFFANYYGALSEEVEGRHEEALALLREAVASKWGRSSDNGPVFMWQVARLHYESLAARAAAKP